MDIDGACYEFLQLVGQEPKSFDEAGIITYFDEDGCLVRLEKHADILFVEYNPKQVSREDASRLLGRANLRSRPPLPFCVAWLEGEAEPRLIVRLDSKKVTGAALLDALGFLKQLVG